MKTAWPAGTLGLLGLCLTGAGADVAGQTREPLRPGDRVRVTAVRPPGERTGRVLRLGDGTLELEAEGGQTFALSYERVRRVERSLGRRSHVLRGALIGGGIGFGLGAAYGALIVNALCESVDGCGDDVLPAMLVVGGLAGAGGALVGAGIGALASGERWEPVRWPPSEGRLSLGAFVARGRTFVGLRLALP